MEFEECKPQFEACLSST